MKRTKMWLLLGAAAAVLVTGGLLLLDGRERDRKIVAALPPPQLQVLEQSERFLLYSLDPEPLHAEDRQATPNFHGYPILGQTRVRETPRRADLLAALRQGLGRRSACACFRPHHGVRAVRGLRTVDLLISFGCEQMEIYDDRGLHRISVSPAVQSVFDHALAEYDVPLSP